MRRSIIILYADITPHELRLFREPAKQKLG